MSEVSCFATHTMAEYLCSTHTHTLLIGMCAAIVVVVAVLNTYLLSTVFAYQ